MKRRIIIIAVSLLICLVFGGITAVRVVKTLKISNSIKDGNKYLLEGKYQKALSDFEKAIGIEPVNVEALVGLGMACIGLEKYKEAEEALKDALGIDSKNPDAYIQLSRLYLITSRASEALSVLHRGYESTKDEDIKSEFEYLKSTVTSPDIYETVDIGKAFSLPKVLKVKINTEDAELTVDWRGNTVETSKPGSYTYVGRLEVIDKEVKLNLTVVSSQDEAYGNTSGNLANLGLIAEKDGWVYRIEVTSPHMTGGNLYKMRPDGSEKTLLTDKATGFLNIVDDWIYYQNGADMFNIYKIRTDGTECTRLNEDESWNINIFDKWIYYNNFSDNMSIYKMRTDGTERTKLSYKNADIYVKDGWIYAGLWKMRIDGTEETYLGEDSAHCSNIVDGWIYYINSMDNKIYKVRTNGTGRTKLCDDTSTSINVRDDWIYYSRSSAKGRLYRIGTDGTNRTRICSDDSTYINVVESGIYYINRFDNESMYRINFDGSGRRRVK